MKKFSTLKELESWYEDQKYDRFSPYDIFHVDRVELIIYYIRVD